MENFTSRIQHVINVYISPEHISYREITNKINEKINNMYNKHIKDIGIVLTRPVLIKILDNSIDPDNSIVKFNVKIEMSVYKPEINQIFECNIINITSNGLYAKRDIIDIFILKNEKNNHFVIGKKCLVKITKIGYSKDKFLLIGIIIDK